MEFDESITVLWNLIKALNNADLFFKYCEDRTTALRDIWNRQKHMLAGMYAHTHTHTHIHTHTEFTGHNK